MTRASVRRTCEGRWRKGGCFGWQPTRRSEERQTSREDHLRRAGAAVRALAGCEATSALLARFRHVILGEKKKKGFRAVPLRIRRRHVSKEADLGFCVLNVKVRFRTGHAAAGPSGTED